MLIGRAAVSEQDSTIQLHTLLQRWRAGDRWARSEFYKRGMQQLVRLADRLIGWPGGYDADDAVVSALGSFVYMKTNRFPTMANCGPYLLRS